MVGGSNSCRFKGLPNCTQQVACRAYSMVGLSNLHEYFLFFWDNQIYKNLESTFMWVF